MFKKFNGHCNKTHVNVLPLPFPTLEGVEKRQIFGAAIKRTPCSMAAIVQLDPSQKLKPGADKLKIGPKLVMRHSCDD